MPDAVKKIANTIKKIKLRMNPHPPIVVWQMGKVGSSSVYQSLKSSRVANPVFHIHFLNPQNLKRVQHIHEEKGLSLPTHIYDGKTLLDRYEKNSGNGWKIITLVRELSKIKISSFFQNLNLYTNDYNNLLTKKGEVNTDLARKILEKEFCNFDESKDYVCTWFDNEIKPMTKIDVFSHPFDHEKGYTIIKENNIDLLILKTELLNSTFDEAISRFLDADVPIGLKNANISGKKSYSDAFKKINSELVIPNDVLYKIHSSRYMSHFYPLKTSTVT